MAQNRIHAAVLEAMFAVRPTATQVTTASWMVQLRARWLADRLDREVDTAPHGAVLAPDTPLAVHVARLTSPAERQVLAQSLRLVLREARDGSARKSRVVPVRGEAVRSVGDLIDEVARQLRAPCPVRARGVARLRLLLSDGRGPLYRPGSGSLNAALRGVLAAL